MPTTKLATPPFVIQANGRIGSKGSYRGVTKSVWENIISGGYVA